MKILVACEESQAVTTELRIIGHEAYSCDILPCSGGHPEWHINQDVLPLLDDSWDMIIAFPPCTHLAVSGARWFAIKKADGRQQDGIDFFMKFINANCKKIVVENPIGIMSSLYRKPDQIIQPWQFGHGESKATCLWLKNVPKLIPTNIVSGRLPRVHFESPGPMRSIKRSKTYKGIAEAMSNQWSACAKRRVVARIEGENTWIGENTCVSPVVVCPRSSCDGYEKCSTVCHQTNHAEINALLKAGNDAKGARMIISGHDHCCDPCLEAMKKAGIQEVVFV